MNVFVCFHCRHTVETSCSATPKAMDLVGVTSTDFMCTVLLNFAENVCNKALIKRLSCMHVPHVQHHW